jgi:hypothetical protein
MAGENIVDETSKSVDGLSKKVANLQTAIKTVFDLTPTGLKKTIDEAFDTISKFQDKNISVARSLGQGAGFAKSIEGELGKAAVNIVKMGGKLEDVIDIYKGINAELGRTTFLSEKFLVNAKAIKTFGVDEKTINSFGSFFDKVGGGMDASISKQIELVNTAQKYGLNTGQFLTTVAGKLDIINKYGFPKGVNDLASMVAKSQVLGDTLSVAQNFADQIMDSPEKAFEYAAQLQTLGGSFSQLGDGAQLLYMAQNDLKGLNDQLINATRGIATFNEESGQFEISANERLRLRGLKNLGIDADKIEEAALKLAKNEKILSGFKGVAFDGMSDEDKQTLVNISEVGKGGEIKIGGKGLEELNQAPQTLTKLLEQVQNKGNQLSGDLNDKNNLKNNTEVVQSQMSANEQLTTATNQLNTMFASTIITTDNFSKGLDNMANNMTKVGGSMDAFVTKNSVLMTGAYNTALKGSDAIDLAVKNATGDAISEKGLEKPIDIKQEITVKVEGLDVDFANIIKPIIKDYLESRLKKVALKSGYSE